MPGALPTLTERLFARASKTPDGVAYLSRSDDEKWRSITWNEVAGRVRTLAAAFSRLGLASGDRIAIMLPTLPEWEYCQHAALAVGGIVVGLDAHDSPKNLRHILDLTQPRVLVVSNEVHLALITDIWRMPEIVIVSDTACAAQGVHILGKLLRSEHAETFPQRLPSPDQNATIIFTSGSTGQPKGIAYSHRQVVLACDAILECFPSITSDARLVCWLPLSNLFQRIINLCAVERGIRSYFIDKPTEIAQLLPEIEPTMFIGVPRFFEKLHAGMLSELEKRPAPVRMLVLAAWAVGAEAAQQRRETGHVSLLWRSLLALANPVLNRLRAVMGQRLQLMISGSAPLPTWLLSRFHGLGWLVLEAYGVSENVMPVAINTLECYRFGSVGRALAANELAVADDGELLVRGPGVFSGYYGDSAQETPLTPEGFLHTGDFARVDADGYLWLEGRKSEVFKTSTGRRIAPAPIEAALKQIDYVDHAVIFGRDRPYPVAIITIDPGHPVAMQIQSDSGLDAVGADVAAACRPFAGYQHPGAVIVSVQPFDIATGELTANLKIRRNPIEARFQSQIDEAYRQSRTLADRASHEKPLVIRAP